VSAEVDLRAGYLKITASEGGDIVLPVTYRDPAGAVVALATGYTALLQIWRARNETSPVVTMTDTDGLTLADTAPNLLIDATSAQIAVLSADVYRYGLRLTPDGGDPLPLLFGPLIIETANVRV
jgi:expansin (peptidoglycan-binding protein)